VCLLVLGVACLATPSVASAEDPPTTPAGPQIMIVGDSISDPLRYSQTETATTPKAWWAYLVDAYDTPPPILSAESGSGMMRVGYAANGHTECSGTTFGQRLADIRKTPWRLLIIEGGRNDFRHCVHGKAVPASRATTESHIRTYLHDLRAVINTMHVNRHKVFVFTPWGTAYTAERAYIRPMVAKWALHYGFRWIDVPALRQANSAGDAYLQPGGTHPTTHGSKRIYLDMINPKLSDLASKLKQYSITS
jgi:hypothetical protein